MVDVLRKLKYSVDNLKESFERIYFSFIRPKLGCHIWDNCDKGDMKQELSEANHRARRSAGEKLNISPLDISEVMLASKLLLI